MDLNPMMYLTDWHDANEPVETVRGPVPFIDWCNAEAERMTKNGRTASAEFNGRGGAALKVDRVA